MNLLALRGEAPYEQLHLWRLIYQVMKKAESGRTSDE